MRCICRRNEVVDVIGQCDPDKIVFEKDMEGNILNNNWTEISIPELLNVPKEKPCIETIDKVFINVKIISKRIVKTPEANVENEEGTKLTGSKLIVEGILHQKIVYTADVEQQTVHSAHFDIPFSAFIIIPKQEDDDETVFCVEPCIEDVYVKAFGCRQIFKNVTLFLRAVPLETCTIIPL